MMRILVTGGAGYIGSHASRELSESGFHPVVLDNLSEGHSEAILEAEFVEGSLGDAAFVESVFQKYDFQAVMHFASRCYVGESMVDPLLYYSQNLGSVINLLQAMTRHQVDKFILSSTCATYGEPQTIPMAEDHPQDPVNPYGESKYFIERILRSCDRAYGVKSVSLRYFNAAGASLDGRLGESHDPETHLIPRVLQVAKGELEQVQIFGEDYSTSDGTCVRDYIHVVDLARAHLRAVEWLANGGPTEFFNLGTGRGVSVREVVGAASRITGRSIPVEMGPRRFGDPPELVADTGKANRVLGWRARYSDLSTLLETAWKWEQNRRY